MADRLSHKKHTSPEDRGVDTHNIAEHSQQVSDAMRANYNLLSGKCSLVDVASNESYTEDVVVESLAIVDIASVNLAGKLIKFFSVKTITISVTAATIVTIHQELESVADGAGPVKYTFNMDALDTIVIPFGFGDNLQAGDLLNSGDAFKLSVTNSAGIASVTMSGIARTE